jgi:hypothetical protein
MTEEALLTGPLASAADIAGLKQAGEFLVLASGGMDPKLLPVGKWDCLLCLHDVPDCPFLWHVTR